MLASIDATTEGARVLFCLTKGDDEVEAEVVRAGRERAMFPPRPIGDWAHKVNTGARLTEQPLIFTGADDLEFRVGWFEAATAKLEPGIGVVGTNDMGNPRVMAGDHATHFLVTREYMKKYGTVDEPGKILHEGYWHELCDDELVATAKHRSAWVMALTAEVKHRHPNWDPLVPTDPLYDRQRERMRFGRRLFAQRRRLWGG